MYRGGFIVDAEICDYESSRKLGIVCPFCSQAVFLRKGTLYDRANGKRIVVSPSFAHYKNDDPLSADCELRAERKDGKEYIRTLEIESRNQRLDLYNKRLWEVVKEDLKVFGLKEASRAFGKQWIEQNSTVCRLELNKRLEFYLEEARRIWNRQTREYWELLQSPELQEIAPNFEIDPNRWVADLFRLNSFDRQLQQCIFEEVIEFLATRTGGYAFQKLYQVALIELCTNIWLIRLMSRPGVNAIPACAEQVKKSSVDTIVKMIVILITRCNWVKLFYGLEDPQQY